MTAPTIVGRDGVERPVGEGQPAAVTVEAGPRDIAWRADAETRLLELEARHQSAQEKAHEIRTTMATHEDRITKGRGMINAVAEAGDVPPPDWEELLDALELEYAGLSLELGEACIIRDGHARDFVVALRTYEQRICVEEGRIWSPWPGGQIEEFRA